MNKLAILFFLIISPFFVHGQITNRVESTPFPIGNNWGWFKVKQLQNGNTALVEIENSGKISISLFDSNTVFKIKNSFFLKQNGNALRNVSLIDIFESKGQLSLFLAKRIDKSETLFRVSINTNTGESLFNDVIMEIHPDPAGAYFAKKSSKVIAPFFAMHNDINTGCYAVVGFSPYSETNERIEYSYFNAEHRCINRSFFLSPNPRFKYIDFVGMIVKGEEFISLITSSYNTFFSGGKESTLCISKIVPNGTPSHLEFSLEFKSRNIASLVNYDSNSGYLYVLLNMLEKNITDGEYYVTQSIVVDPSALKILYNPGIPRGKLAKAYSSKIKSDVPNKLPRNIGMPQLHKLNANGNPFLLFQRLNSKGGFGDVFITCYNNEGESVYGDFIRCRYAYRSAPFRFAHDYNGHDKYKTPQFHDIDIKVFPDFDYFHIDFASTRMYSYLFMNMDKRNIVRDESKKAFKTKKFANMELCVLQYSNEIGFKNKVVLSKNGGAEKKKRTLFYNPQSGDFDSRNNKYSVLLMEKMPLDKDGKQLFEGRVVWFNLD